MGAPSRTEERGRAARHRRTGEPLIRRRDRTAERPRRRLPFPAPPPSALIGIAVLVLIGAGVIHLSGAGSAVPREEDAGAPIAEAPVAEFEDSGAEGAGGGDGAASPAPPADADGAAEADAREDAATAGSTAEGSAELVVHVSGAVAAPGVVRLAPGSRVDDALRAAGGANGEADLAAVNLARPVIDGEQIHVPVPGEEPPAAQAPAASAPGDGAAGGSADAHGGGSGAGGAIDLNTASAAELEGLPGVGPAIAQRIIDHREQNGPFESVDQLQEVSGIGPATLEKLRDRATV
jgi:competence protein ComEA